MSHPGGSGNFIYTLATGAQETEVARLVSPVVTVGQSDLCVSFWYHMFGSHIGTLHIKQRKETVDGMADILLWTISGHQGNRWREGRVLVPHSSKPYQVWYGESLHTLNYKLGQINVASYTLKLCLMCINTIC